MPTIFSHPKWWARRNGRLCLPCALARVIGEPELRCRTGLFHGCAACYVQAMSDGLKELLEKTAFWPEEDQEELAAVAAEIEARRTGRYAMSDAERAAVDNGLQQVQRGEFASDEEMRSFWKRFGVA